jgi:hypothetical protein
MWRQVEAGVLAGMARYFSIYMYEDKVHMSLYGGGTTRFLF